jgi:hypothetical protein
MKIDWHLVALCIVELHYSVCSRVHGYVNASSFDKLSGPVFKVKPVSSVEALKAL